MQRRQFLTRAAAAFAAAGLPLPLLEAVASPVPLGQSHPFDYAWLKGHARAMAARAFEPRSDVLPPAVAALDWDQYQSIAFRQDHALWGDLPGSNFQARTCFWTKSTSPAGNFSCRSMVRVFTLPSGLVSMVPLTNMLDSTCLRISARGALLRAAAVATRGKSETTKATIQVFFICASFDKVVRSLASAGPDATQAHAGPRLAPA